MNPKLILAEGLEVLRKAESKELEADKLQEAIVRSTRLRRELPRLKGAYSLAYDTFIRGLELVNFVRRTAISVAEHDLVRFCEVRMNHYMDRCEALRNKEANILLPIQLMSAIAVRSGFEVKDRIGHLSATEGILEKSPWHFTAPLHDGSYMIRAKNIDDFSVAAPSVVVEILVDGIKGQPIHIRKTIPCQCGWVRYIGVVGKGGTLQLHVRSDAILRECHVEVELFRLEEVEENAWMHTLPSIDDIVLSDDPKPTNAASSSPLALPAFKPPPPRVILQVQPRGVGLVDRLALVRRKLDTWPTSNVGATKLDKSEQFVLQAIHQLPIPTDLCGGDAALDVNFDVHAGELEHRHDDE